MLTPSELAICKQILIFDEGVKYSPYMDCCGRTKIFDCTCYPRGHITIGIGRNLDIGISDGEAQMMLSNDIERISISVDRVFSWFDQLNTARKIVIISMAFNLGLQGLRGFKQMLSSMEQKDYESAASHMLNSKWASQVGRRAVRLSETMRTGMLIG